MEVVSFCCFFCNLLSVSLYVDLIYWFSFALQSSDFTEEGGAWSVVSDAQMLLDVWGTGDGSQLL